MQFVKRTQNKNTCVPSCVRNGKDRVDYRYQLINFIRKIANNK